MTPSPRPPRPGRLTALAIAYLAGAVLLGHGIWRHGRNTPPAAERLVRDLSAGEDPGPTLLFIFRPDDCAGFSGLIDRWGELHRSGALRVVGVGTRFSNRTRRALEERDPETPGFPVRYDLARLAERLMSVAGHTTTPTSLLLDGTGRLRLAIPPTSDPKEQARLAEQLRREVRHLLEDENGP